MMVLKESRKFEFAGNSSLVQAPRTESVDQFYIDDAIFCLSGTSKVRAFLGACSTAHLRRRRYPHVLKSKATSPFGWHILSEHSVQPCSKPASGVVFVAAGPKCCHLAVPFHNFRRNSAFSPATKNIIPAGMYCVLRSELAHIPQLH